MVNPSQRGATSAPHRPWPRVMGLYSVTWLRGAKAGGGYGRLLASNSGLWSLVLDGVVLVLVIIGMAMIMVMMMISIIKMMIMIVIILNSNTQ